MRRLRLPKKNKSYKEHLERLIQFITYDIWRVTREEVSRLRHILYTSIKVLYVSIRNVRDDSLNSMASSLTYSSLLSTVPMLAVMFAIARGFGFQQILDSQFSNYFSSNAKGITQLLNFVNNYLEQTKGGIFMGVGLAVMLYTVINLITVIELKFNSIWNVKKSRSFYRKLIDYFAVLLIIPIFFLLSTGITLFISTSTTSELGLPGFFNPLLSLFTNVLPYILIVFMFLLLFVFLPNTRVKIRHAIIPAIVSGLAFQIFQTIYISAQILLSKYNTIYGSFAVLPFFLLWMQISWVICLFGVELTFVAQNINHFSFERDSKTISRRYYDFLTLVITSLIVKRFDNAEPPITMDEISINNNIPIQLTNEILDFLLKIELIRETPTKDERVMAYLPASDTHNLSVGMLLQKIDEHGSENFKTENNRSFKREWEILLKAKRQSYEINQDVLIRDL